MRILFFTDSLCAGGKERRLTELLKALRSMPDMESELVLMNRNIHYKEVLELGINVTYIIRKVKKDPVALFKFYKYCKDHKPNIVHCWDSMTAIYSVPVCKLLNIKFINGMVVNSLAQHKTFNNLWFRARITFPFSDVIIGNSQSGLVSYKSPEERSIVIYNGFDFNRINNLIPADVLKAQYQIDTKFIVGMVASFSDFKDYKTYYKAARLLFDRRKDVTFLAIGYNTDSDESMNLVGSQYLRHFRLMGTRSGIESYINLMDICVLSTYTEGLSNSILEYMALGKPVIATSGGGTNEIVKDNETGFLVNQSDPEELAGKMEILLNDDDLRTKMGLAGKKKVLTGFSIEQMISKYCDLYRSLV